MSDHDTAARNDGSIPEYPDPDIAANATSYPWRTENQVFAQSIANARFYATQPDSSSGNHDWGAEQEPDSERPNVDSLSTENGSDSDFSISDDLRR